MVEGEAASSGLSIDDVHRIYERCGPDERELLRDLLERGTPREAMVFAQLLHYFPSAYLTDEEE